MHSLYDVTEEDRRLWFEQWFHGALVANQLAKLAYCLNLANQLEVNGASFDLHIQKVSPTISGGLTTSIAGFQPFENLSELEAWLLVAVNELKDSYEAKSG